MGNGGGIVVPLEQELQLLTEVVGTGQKICQRDETTRLAAAAVRAAVLRIVASTIVRAEAALDNLRRELDDELEPVQALVDQHCMLNQTHGCIMAYQSVMQMQFEMLGASDGDQEYRRLADELGAASDQIGILASKVAAQIEKQQLAVDADLEAAEALMDAAANEVSSLSANLKGREVSPHVPAAKTYQSIHVALKAIPGHGAGQEV